MDRWAKSGFKASGNYFVVSRRQDVFLHLVQY
jgi:hypothetical protein